MVKTFINSYLFKSRKLNPYRIIFIAIVFYGGLMIWFAPHLPMVDLPQHAGQVALLHDLWDGNSKWQQFLHVNYFTPYLLGYGLAFLLSFLMPIASAFKILLTISFYGFVFSCVLLRKRFCGDRRLDWLFVPGYFGFAYTWGLFTFLLAAPFGLLFILFSHHYAQNKNFAMGVMLAFFSSALFFFMALYFYSSIPLV